jgi:4-diphosphocytidyl-2-C-methyl-D-erythritol kinase
MIVYPNAKINLGLNILRKRVDGYHDISSIFYPVKEIFDILEIIPSTSFSFSSSGTAITNLGNICIRAFDLLKADFNISPVRISLHKQIPVGAGLGGGSADGAFTLIALNQIFDLNIPNFQLEKYALKLGADCPFFIYNTPKYITGIGDMMTSVDLDLTPYEIKFIFSDLHISTAEAYAGIVTKENKVSLLESINQPMKNWRENVKNDFEASAFKKYPELQKQKKDLYNNGAIYASMTGSGSVLYGIFTN